MRYEDWEPFYLKIVNEFGYSIAEDSRAAGVLVELVTARQRIGDVDSFMGERVRGRAFSILGPCPMDAERFSKLGAELGPGGSSLVTVGEGTKNAMDAGLTPSMIFTDLDGFPEYDMLANEKGAVVVIHAHGDNMTRLRAWVPRFQGRIIPTCQCAPISGASNWGGFTDGDRACCALRHFGAKEISLKVSTSPSPADPSTWMSRLRSVSSNGPRR